MNTSRAVVRTASGLLLVLLLHAPAHAGGRSLPFQQQRLGVLLEQVIAREAAPRFDPTLIDAGRVLFQEFCTACHPANRALEVEDDLPGWRATIRRMQRKPGAGLPDGSLEPIAIYLASLSAPDDVTTTVPEGTAAIDPEAVEPPADGTPDVLANTTEVSPFDFYATVAPFYRVSARDSRVENDGFFPSAWVGIDWHPETPLGARVSACFTCHRSSEAEGNRIEVAEAVLRMDVGQVLGTDERGFDVAVEAGRFIVPFGSPGERSHFRGGGMVTQSLLFNMGQNVYRDDLGPALLPMPYADEGVLITNKIQVAESTFAGLDAYVVNGLQGGTEVDFFQSRDYSDNNSEPAIGGRVSLTGPYLHAGVSYMAGRLNEEDSAGPLSKRLGYQIYGADVSFRYRDQVRLLVEYAKRQGDQIVFGASDPRGDQDLSGINFQGQVRALEDPGVSVVARWDRLERDADSAPFTSRLTEGDYTVRRFTWGFSFDLPGGSVLMLNHEHWNLPPEFEDLDLIALRWVASF